MPMQFASSVQKNYGNALRPFRDALFAHARRKVTPAQNLCGVLDFVPARPSLRSASQTKSAKSSGSTIWGGKIPNYKSQILHAGGRRSGKVRYIFGAALGLMRLRSVEERHGKHRQQCNDCGNVKNGEIHARLTFVAHRPNENDRSDSADNNIGEEKRIHKFADGDCARATLNMRHAAAAIDPPMNDGNVTTVALGTKNPSTVEAKSILDKSAKYFERISIWALFISCILPWYRRSSGDVKCSIHVLCEPLIRLAVKRGVFKVELKNLMGF